MENYFDRDIAQSYDDECGDQFDPSVTGPAADTLAELTGSGAALEFAIGTGRIALPMLGRGIRVSGIEFSQAMIDALKRKPQADEIEVVLGDMATTKVRGESTLVYLVFNTIGNLTTQDQQVACFQNAADHLASGGHFVVEVGEPDLRLLPPGQNVVPFEVTSEHVGFDVYDDLTHKQQMSSHHYRPRSDGVIEENTLPFRYVWPAELDLMARLAGMGLVSRWAGWDRSPFTGESRSHVSVWRKL